MKVYSREARIDNSSPRAARAERAALLRRFCFALLLLLATQFLLGMLTNLYVKVPDSHPGSGAPEYFSGVVQGVVWTLASGAGWLRLHAVVGLLLFLGALAFVYYAIAARDRGWIIIAVVGVLGIVAAGFNGASFLNYGHDFSSLLMSIGFLVALVAYLIGLYRTP
jgi:hypothetical protein